MIVEKGHFHFAEKCWGGGQGPPAPPVPTALYFGRSVLVLNTMSNHIKNHPKLLVSSKF